MYAFFDGDNIGDIVQILLLENKLEEASKFSNDLKMTFIKIQSFLSEKEDIKIIILGGDDLLIKYDATKYKLNIINDIIEIFQTSILNRTSISCGLGNTVEEAINNLGKAKLFGKNRIYPPKAM